MFRRKQDNEKLYTMLDNYREEKCLGLRNCKKCTFSIDNDTRCALNLVCNAVQHNLSTQKEVADKQWDEIMGFDENDDSEEDSEEDDSPKKDKTPTEQPSDGSPIKNDTIFNHETLTDGEAIHFLAKYLLGDDWYSIYMHHDQINTDITHSILRKYSRKYRKDRNLWLKKKR